MDNKAFLGKRRDRAIATILSFKERDCDSYLSKETSQALRKIILDEINDICDLAFDLMSSDEDVIWNSEFMDRLDDIYNKISEISEE